MPAANGHEVSSQSHLLEVVGTRQPAAACCLFACLDLDHHQDIRMRDINTTTPPQTSPRGRAQTNKNHHCHKRTSRPSDPALFIPKRRAAPRLALASAPALRSLFALPRPRTTRLTDRHIVARNQPSDLAPTLPPLPPFVQYSSADLGIPKSPIIRLDNSLLQKN